MISSHKIDEEHLFVIDLHTVLYIAGERGGSWGSREKTGAFARLNSAYSCLFTSGWPTGFSGLPTCGQEFGNLCKNLIFRLFDISLFFMHLFIGIC